MKTLITDRFISERIKVQPITNAELDIARDKIEKEMKNVLYIVWPESYDDVYKIEKVVEKECEVQTRANNCMFILKIDDIKKLIANDMINLSSKYYGDVLYKINPKLNEADLRKTISSSYGAIPVRDFLDNPENAHRIYSSDELS